MFLLPAKEVAMGDLILSKEPMAQRRVVQRAEATESGLIGLFTHGHAQYYLPHEEVLVIRRSGSPPQTSEERNAELTRLTEAFLQCLEVDREDDGSTEFLIAMAGAAHALKEKLEEAYCSGERPCFPSGNRESRR